MSKIKEIIAREIKDSRGNPTVEVELETGPGGHPGSFVASVASGASTGVNEALELRDVDGKGVSGAIKNVNEIIAPKLKGKDVLDQKAIDELMIKLDGTENKSKLGANAILGVSMAVCRAGAGSKKVSLYNHIADLAGHKPNQIPLAMFNILEGGVHAKNNLDIQEFIIVPHKKTFAENLVLCNNVFQNLRKNIEENYPDKIEDPRRGRYGKIEMGDEGGFSPQMSNTEQSLYLLKSAIHDEDIKIALDCAASQFYKNGKYKIEGRELTRTELLEFYEGLINNFPIISIEDPFSEEDWQGWEMIMRSRLSPKGEVEDSRFGHKTESEQSGGKIIIVGDDLTTTNIKKIKEAHSKLACNGVILKLNQIGTVSETIEAGNLAKSFGWKIIVSHRSGETMDNFIADLSVGLEADFLKAGSPAKPERMVKYSRLLEIEQELKK